MRFTRGDLPGFVIALLAPPALMLLFLASYETWDHRGTPLLGFMAVNIAVAAAVAAVFSRFVRRWEVPLAMLLVLAAAAAGVIALQRSGHNGGAAATLLKWVGLIDFLLLNLAIGYQVLSNGLLPVLDRHAARRAAADPPAGR
ncbi:MAG: hypothetical protein EXR65_00575 [Dehalococcoidia bacterium]|nr:hypothetical protein [Dehalococcoidia bacterium]